MTRGVARRGAIFSLAGVGGLASLVLAIQLVPYGHSHANPPVLGEPAWSNPPIRALFVRACGDCHSNETDWPWYSNVAPVSWLVQRDVDKGRYQFNVSNWPSGSGEARDSAEEIQRGPMPPGLLPAGSP